MKVKNLRVLLLPLLVGFTAPAAAVDCTVNVLEAHNVAKLRGWTFACKSASAAPGALSGGTTAHFVTYPPDGIGCTYKTPPMIGPMNPTSSVNLGGGSFFVQSGSPPALKNGWSVKSYEISGGQWKVSNTYGSGRIAFATSEPPKPNHTYNYKVSKLVLTHPTSICSKALDEAF